ncbi:hypothetical protein TomMM35A_18460 [Sphingobium sp. TomMM35A]
MAKKPTTKTKRAVTVAALGETYTLLMGTAALLHMEKALGVPLAEMKDKLATPGLETVRDMLAACLVEHHPQTTSDTSVAAGLSKALGLSPVVQVIWPLQQQLANRIMDAVGLGRTSDLIGDAFETSPYFSEAVPPSEESAAAE